MTQRLHSRTVLIVDRSPVLSTQWQEVLVSLGLSVHCTHTLEAAKNFIANTPNLVDYLIIDPNLPDGSAMPWLQRLLRSEHAGGVAAVHDGLDSAQSLELTCDGALVLPKPLGCSSIPALLRILERQRRRKDGVVGFAQSHHLSPRETQVLDAQLNGLSDKTIADTLDTTEQAINQIVRRIHRKLGASTFREIVAQWRRYLTEEQAPFSHLPNGA